MNYQEVVEVLNIFKFDLDDQDFEKVQITLNHPDRSDSNFSTLFKEIFTKVVATSNQELIIRFFKEAFDGSNDLYVTGEKMFFWYKKNVLSYSNKTLA